MPTFGGFQAYPPKDWSNQASLSDKPSFSYGPFRNLQERNPANDSSRKLRVGRSNFLLGKAYFHGRTVSFGDGKRLSSHRCHLRLRNGKLKA